MWLLAIKDYFGDREDKLDEHAEWRIKQNLKDEAYLKTLCGASRHFRVA
jgi:hypothetical protein